MDSVLYFGMSAGIRSEKQETVLGVFETLLIPGK